MTRNLEWAFAGAIALVIGCGSDARWTELVGESELASAALGAWGTGTRNVYVAGGGLGRGGAPLALRFDGTEWIDVASPVAPGTDAGTDTFWAVGGARDGSAVMFVGEDGATARYQGDVLEPLTSPTALPLVAVWGETADDMWAVGGDPAAGTGVLLHFDGAGWTDETGALPAVVPLFGVWASGPDDVWVVGSEGVAMHFDGASWTTADTGTAIPLLAVSGVSAGEVYAVGGPPATVLRWDGAAFSPEDLGFLSGAVLRGVSAAERGDVLAVGAGGTKLHRRDGEWVDESDAAPVVDLRGAWVDASGAAYAVGGNFTAPAGTVRTGAIGFFGEDPPPKPRL